MIESRILAPNDRIELINGEILEKPSITPQHAACIDRLAEFLVLQLVPQAIVRIQSPIYLNDYSEPQPDLALLKRRDDFYAMAHPRPDDIFLVIEIADVTSDFDRDVKIPSYAQAGIPETWFIDLNAQVVETYRQTTAQNYQQIQQWVQNQTLSSSSFPTVHLGVNRILGAPIS